MGVIPSLQAHPEVQAFAGLRAGHARPLPIHQKGEADPRPLP